MKQEDFEATLALIGKKIKSLRIKAGYKSYEVFAYENDLSRIQYWKMEKGVNCTFKSLQKVLDIHEMNIQEFFCTLKSPVLDK